MDFGREIGICKSVWFPPLGVSGDMTDWRSVGIGFVLQVVFGIVAFAFPGIGTIIAGFLAGVISGYITRRGTTSGAWHALLSGALGGVVVAILAGIALSVVGLTFNSLIALVGGGGVLIVGVLISVLTAIPSAIGGAVGGFAG